MAKVKLTAPQLEELKLLAQKRQSTRGKRRARVQNNLVRRGFARFCEEDGTVRQGLDLLRMLTSYGNLCPYCEIADAGREALKP